VGRKRFSPIREDAFKVAFPKKRGALPLLARKGEDLPKGHYYLSPRKKSREVLLRSGGSRNFTRRDSPEKGVVFFLCQGYLPEGEEIVRKKPLFWLEVQPAQGKGEDLRKRKSLIMNHHDGFSPVTAFKEGGRASLEGARFKKKKKKRKEALVHEVKGLREKKKGGDLSRLKEGALARVPTEYVLVRKNGRTKRGRGK